MIRSKTGLRVIGLSKYDLVLLALIAGLVGIFSVTSRSFLGSFNLTTLMINFSILFLASIGGTFVIMVGGLDLSYSGVLTLSAILAALLLPEIGLWAVLVGILFGTVFGAANGVLFVKARIPSFLVTLGTLYISTGLSNLATPGGLSIPLGGELDFLLVPIIPGVHTLLIWAIVLAAVLYLLSHFTSYGWRVYATGSNEFATILNGVGIGRVRILTFALSGSLAGLTGILLLSYFGAGTSYLGTNLVFIPLAVIVLGGTALSGGVGGPHRTVVGAFLIALILDGLALTGASPGVVTFLEGIAIIVTTTIVSREIRSLVM